MCSPFGFLSLNIRLRRPENPDFRCIFARIQISNDSNTDMADEKIIFSMVGVSKTFTNQKKVLNNIYLSFFYGAKIGIIGLNGSGKTERSLSCLHG